MLAQDQRAGSLAQSLLSNAEGALVRAVIARADPLDHRRQVCRHAFQHAGERQLFRRHAEALADLLRDDIEQRHRQRPPGDDQR